jgi:hypothetical protein
MATTWQGLALSHSRKPERSGTMLARGLDLFVNFLLRADE